jgi:carbamoyltransferase
MTILGISAYYHDSAAAIVIEGEIIAAAQEERFTRIKNDKNFPAEAIKYCLSEAGKSIDDMDAVVFYDKSFLKFERLIETYYSFAPKGILSFFKSIPAWLNEKIFIKRNIRKELKKIQDYDPKKLNLLFTEHHLSHAASAFFPSGFEEAAILTIDGAGEWATTTICKGKGNKIEVLKEIKFPHSVGLLYSAFTYYLGFTVNSDEYKLMGLAPYGNSESEETSRFIDLIKSKILKLFDDGSIILNQEYFEYAYGLKMTNNKRFEQLFGVKRREPGEEFTRQHLNLAYAIQNVSEEIILNLARYAKQFTGCSNLCMAGGVALNCVANGKIVKENIFDNLFIQPAAGDAGGALGAALACYHIYFNNNNLSDKSPTGDKMKGAYLGPSFSNSDILAVLDDKRISYKKFSDFSLLCEEVATLICDGSVIGWFQGRMEFGPRALGNRSILGNPSYSEMQKKLNLKIKFRESFRPFAPVVLAEDLHNYFELVPPSPYMLLVSNVKKNELNILPENYNNYSLTEKLYYPRSEKLQAVTHVDGTARIQTITADTNLRIYQLLIAYKKITGFSVLVNTSFNVKDEPIVCTPGEAVSCFLKTEMDFLVLGDFLITRNSV